ncbi:basic salivary proline-rich protein 3-like [Marmota flaviventris]|uniref:basic salivary proline-rich protein 3-like n=1 Tax=Marmota flaviventris TaxID=93162 RepID=UPI003A87373D
MAKPLPAPRTPDAKRLDSGRDPQFSGVDEKEDHKRLEAAPGRAEQLQQSPRPDAFALRGPQGAGWDRSRGARRRGGLGAPGRRAGRSSDGRLPCGSRVPGQPRRAGRRAEGGKESAGPGQRPEAERRCGPAGTASRAGPPLTIDPGERAAARARGRRVGAVPCPGARSGEGRLPARRSLLSPRSSRPAEQVEGISVSAAGAVRARAFVYGEGAGTDSARRSSLRPAPPSPPRRVSAARALSESYKHRAPPRDAQPIGPLCSSGAMIG